MESKRILACPRGLSRRQMAGRMAALFASGAALPLFTESALAQQAEREFTGSARPAVDEYVRINSNENPLGPCREGLDAIAKIGPSGGRYNPFQDYENFIKSVAESEDIPPTTSPCLPVQAILSSAPPALLPPPHAVG